VYQTIIKQRIHHHLVKTRIPQPMFHSVTSLSVNDFRKQRVAHLSVFFQTKISGTNKGQCSFVSAAQ